MPSEPGEPLPPPQPQRRRPRYGGTHPRHFEQRYKELDPQTYPDEQDHVRAQGRTPAGTHVPIMKDEVLALLVPKPGEVVVDCTVGFGGHSQAFLERIESTGRLIGLDGDGRELRRTAQRWARDEKSNETPEIDLTDPWRPLPQVCFRHMHFAGVGKALAEEGLDGCDVLFADLGASSMQFDDPTRGFSYKFDAPLDMRMDERIQRTAADLLMTMSEEELSAALLQLADEPDHAAIARRIMHRRNSIPIRRSRELVKLIFEAKYIDEKKWRAARRAGDTSLHPAARTFQTLRMLVNDEIKSLEQLLRIAPYCLRSGGRFGVLSFHSGEHQRIGLSLHNGREQGLYESICPEPIQPTLTERSSNPRSRSALFHWATRAAVQTHASLPD